MNLPLEIPETPTPALEKARRAYDQAKLEYDELYDSDEGLGLLTDEGAKIIRRFHSLERDLRSLEEQARKEAR